MANFTWFKRKMPDGLVVRQVYGIVFDEEGKVLLRIEDGRYKLSGGKPEGNESFEETLRREYLEELNTDIDDINYLGYLLVDDGDKYAQVRMVARIKDIHDIHVDPATGKTYGRKLVCADKLKEFLNYSDEAGNQMLDDAIDLAKYYYKV